MHARVKNIGSVTVVELAGRVEIENIEAFKEGLLDKLSTKPIVFNLKDLSFVGSNGITPFVQTMSDFACNPAQPAKFCGVSSEFKRIFESSPLKEIEICANESQAVDSLGAPKVNTVENHT